MPKYCIEISVVITRFNLIMTVKYISPCLSMKLTLLNLTLKPPVYYIKPFLPYLIRHNLLYNIKYHNSCIMC